VNNAWVADPIQPNGGSVTGNIQSTSSTIVPASGGASQAFYSPASQQGVITFYSAGSAKWQIGKQNDDSFFIYDSVNGALPISVTTNGNVSIGESKLVTINGALLGLTPLSGWQNKIRNSNFSVWQRGGSFTIGAGSNAITADGWVVYSYGASGAVAAVGAPNVLQLSGNGVTQFNLDQRIEAVISTELAGQCTVQFMIYNGTGAPFTPLLQILHPTVKDNWAGTVQDIYVNMQSCPVGVWTTVAYSFNFAAASAGLGGLVDLGMPVSISGSQYIQVTRADWRLTPGVPTGLVATPPPFEFRDIQSELAFCQRYFETSYDLGTPPGTVAPSPSWGSVTGLASVANTLYVNYPWKVPKRVDPTITFYSPTTGAIGKARDTINNADVSAAVPQSTQQGVVWGATSSVATTIASFTAHIVATAEL
jgi:hypothetical protein